MNTCKDCQHWKKEDERSFGGDCKSGKIVYYKEEYDSSSVVLEDGEDYDAWAETGPDFGCIHWLEKVVIVEAKKENQKLLETK